MKNPSRYQTKNGIHDLPYGNFSWHRCVFTKRPLATMLQLKELALAKRLHTLGRWEERAEDPFRGLRAGPASFSPFLFCADRGKRFLPSHGFPEDTRRLNAGRVLPTQGRNLNVKVLGRKEPRCRSGFELGPARLDVASRIIRKRESQQDRKPEEAGDDDQFCPLGAVLAVHKE
jgi:hypothetical protein